MRNELYDKLLREGMEKIKANPEKFTLAEKKLEAFETVLNETNGEDAITRCRVVLSENSSLWIEGEGIRSLKLMQVR